MRVVQEGNVLWQWYYQLERALRVKLLVDFETAGWSKNTFFADTRKERSLATMSFARLLWYAKWFNTHVPLSEDLVDLATAENEQKAAA